MCSSDLLKKVGAVRRGRKMKRKTPSQRGPKKVAKIDASVLKNLDTELDLPSVDTPSQRGKYICSNSSKISVFPFDDFLHSLTI